jgi:hypothetical protein
VQILHPFTGSAQQYAEEVSTPDRYRPDHCPQCPSLQPLIAHGFYSRTLAEAGFDGSIQVRRYLCRSCRAHGIAAAAVRLALRAFRNHGYLYFWWPACSRAPRSL